MTETEQTLSGEQPTVQMFARFASELHEADGVEETVEAVAQFALHAVGCSAASVALIVRGRRPEQMAMTDPRPGPTRWPPRAIAARPICR